MTYEHIVVIHKYTWSALSSREIDKMLRKYRSVQPRKMVHNWPSWARVEIYTEGKKTIDYAKWCTYGHIMVMSKYTWSTVLSRELVKMPRKWRSVQPRKMVHNWPSWARVEIYFILMVRKPLTMSNDAPMGTSWRYRNMLGAPFRSEK